MDSFPEIKFSSGKLDILYQLNNAERWLGEDMQGIEIIIKIISLFPGTVCKEIVGAGQCNYENVLMKSLVNVFLLLKRFHPPIFMLTRAYCTTKADRQWLN